MTVAAAFFYLFCAVMIASAVMVISARNTVHSVLFLILAFVNAAGIFVLAGAEFLAMILVIVYVGAVAVLFLFVVMMLDVDFAALKEGFLRYLPLGALVGLIVVAELAFVVGSWVVAPGSAGRLASPAIAQVANTQALGQVLYTQYFYLFQVSGFILLSAMIGAIVLTLRRRPDVKRQLVPDQNARTPKSAIEIRKVRSREGV